MNLVSEERNGFINLAMQCYYICTGEETLRSTLVPKNAKEQPITFSEISNHLNITEQDLNNKYQEVLSRLLWNNTAIQVLVAQSPMMHTALEQKYRSLVTKSERQGFVKHVISDYTSFCETSNRQLPILDGMNPLDIFGWVFHDITEYLYQGKGDPVMAFRGKLESKFSKKQLADLKSANNKLELVKLFEIFDVLTLRCGKIGNTICKTAPQCLVELSIPETLSKYQQDLIDEEELIEYSKDNCSLKSSSRHSPNLYEVIKVIKPKEYRVSHSTVEFRYEVKVPSPEEMDKNLKLRNFVFTIMQLLSIDNSSIAHIVYEVAKKSKEWSGVDTAEAPNSNSPIFSRQGSKDIIELSNSSDKLGFFNELMPQSILTFKRLENKYFLLTDYLLEDLLMITRLKSTLETLGKERLKDTEFLVELCECYLDYRNCNQKLNFAPMNVRDFREIVSSIPGNYSELNIQRVRQNSSVEMNSTATEGIIKVCNILLNSSLDALKTLLEEDNLKIDKLSEAQMNSYTKDLRKIFNTTAIPLLEEVLPDLYQLASYLIKIEHAYSENKNSAYSLNYALLYDKVVFDINTKLKQIEDVILIDINSIVISRLANKLMKILTTQLKYCLAISGELNVPNSTNIYKDIEEALVNSKVYLEYLKMYKFVKSVIGLGMYTFTTSKIIEDKTGLIRTSRGTLDIERMENSSDYQVSTVDGSKFIITKNPRTEPKLWDVQKR